MRSIDKGQLAKQPIGHTMQRLRNRSRSGRKRPCHVFRICTFLTLAACYRGAFIGDDKSVPRFFNSQPGSCILSLRLTGKCTVSDENIERVFFEEFYAKQRIPTGRLHNLHVMPEIFHTLAPPGSRNCNTNVKNDAGVIVLTVVTKDVLHSPLSQNCHSTITRARGTHEFVTATKRPNVSFWRTRLEQYLGRLSSMQRDQIVVLADVDSIAVRPLTTLWGQLSRTYGNSVEHAVLFGSEQLCDTDSCVQNSHTTSNKRTYLNAGMMIGRNRNVVKLLKDALVEMNVNERLDDQGAFDAVFKKSKAHNNLIILDTEGVFTYNTPPLPDARSQSEPFFFHFPGMRYSTQELMNLCQRHLINEYNSVLASLMLETKHETVDVYVSLTTTPHRMKNLLPVLNSLLAQTLVPRKIILNIPKVFSRTGQEYDIPKSVLDLPLLVLNKCDDFGPATKLLPTLHLVRDMDAIIVTVDDEYVYPENMLQTLVEASYLNPMAAYGFAGQNVEFDFGSATGIAVRSADIESWNDKRTAVDILEGFLGAAYRRKFFDDSIYKINPKCHTTDDIWFSAHLSRKSIPRVKIPMPFTRPVDDLSGNDSVMNLRSENVQSTKKNEVCARELLDDFRPSWNIGGPTFCIQPLHELLLTTWDDRILDYVDPWWHASKPTSPCTKRYHTVGDHLRAGQPMMVNGMLVDDSLKGMFVLDEEGRLCVTSGDPWKQVGELAGTLVCNKYTPHIRCVNCVGAKISHIVVRDGNIVWYARNDSVRIRSLEGLSSVQHQLGDIIIDSKAFCPPVDVEAEDANRKQGLGEIFLRNTMQSSDRMLVQAFLSCKHSDVPIVSTTIKM